VNGYLIRANRIKRPKLALINMTPNNTTAANLLITIFTREIGLLTNERIVPVLNSEEINGPVKKMIISANIIVKVYINTVNPKKITNESV
jgi:hypothetical protein